ncbi:hypothetical protein SAMN02745165_02720 [Malonomonas rubra DSM 5091]|uniref:Uncharacterized protein n=1 Tax=Malonomonas rubra DSM 5091 TaxID=1122189 RepID=A0A1M6KHI8_MALRU|nr:hypothetical protein [Malonomonas rubra]SHJ58408.1 hypothetical protein SAMN02745165_02720 [Malonomonas rubra DSM 5091]
MADMVKKVTLENGIQVSFFDRSNRYFGDFHRICLQVVIELPLEFALTQGLDRDKAQLERSLEKMGVPSAEVEETISGLIESFLQTATAYLGKPEFPAQMLTKLQQQKRKAATLLFKR